MEKNKLIVKPKLIFLMGPTGVGKTSLVMKLNDFLPIKVISVDSALIYKDMNIGTAKPNFIELKKVPHKLINIIDPSETYSVASFRKDAINEINKIIKQGFIPLLVGGSMFYFRKLIDGISKIPKSNFFIKNKIFIKSKIKGWDNLYLKLKKIDPIYAKRIHKNDKYRIFRALEVFYSTGKNITYFMNNPIPLTEYEIYTFALFYNSKKQMYKNIKERFINMLHSGFEIEVYNLMLRGNLNINMPSIKCIGYKQMWLYLKGKISYKEMIKLSINSTKKLIKKQNTWLNNWKNIYYLNNNQLNLAIFKILKTINFI